MKDSNANQRVIQSIQRAFNVVECFDKQIKELSLNDISKKLNLNKSTVYGIINTLCINGYISQNSVNGKYMLGNRFIIKGQLVSDTIFMSLKNAGVKYLKALSEEYKVVSHLFLYKNNMLSLVEVSIPTNSYYIDISMEGKEFPLYAGSSGKVVLAHMTQNELDKYLSRHSLIKFTEKTLTDVDSLKDELSKIRVSGYSVEDEEQEAGVYSISVPIYDNNEVLIGTISITSLVGKVKENTEELIDNIKNASKKITQELFLI